MNQNRNNNRRRGRGSSNRNGQSGGGSQGNRIDSRARGNAPQMLEKYRKLAHDASLNGDRVQTEYYLQFADHYFRVVADSRTQRDDQRPRQPGEREPSSQDYEFDDEDDMAEMGRPNVYQPRRDRDDEPSQQEGEPAADNEQAEDVVEDANPFVRDERERRPRQRNRNGGARNGAVNNDEAAPEEGPSEDSGGFDPGILPPSIARDVEVEGSVAPRPRRTRRPRTEDKGDEAIEAVG
ncbi:MAG: DUF4167 domain-containing protein [Croceibacterium sp.]